MVITAFEIFSVFCFGLLFGSFFNVLIYRLPRSESILWPPSHCPGCNKPISWHENIPILSYLFLKGKCSQCRSAISIQYPLIELMTGLLSIGLWLTLIEPFYQSSHSVFEQCTFALQLLTLLLLIPVSLIDYYHLIIPDSISLGGLVCSLLCSLLPDDLSPLQSVVGALAGGGILFLFGLFGEYVLRKKDAMGGGDVKLMAFIGALWGWKVALIAIVLASFLGSIIGLSLIIVRLMPKNNKIPFGPFLAGGIWISVLWGEYLVTLYMNWLYSAFQ
ncbi:MAG: prepilin peptidase [Chitinivibrionales bacterium]|nr:prepilin peptidase [Chitinivibrionales bacterium]